MGARVGRGRDSTPALKPWPDPENDKPGSAAIAAASTSTSGSATAGGGHVQPVHQVNGNRQGGRIDSGDP